MTVEQLQFFSDVAVSFGCVCTFALGYLGGHAA